METSAITAKFVEDKDDRSKIQELESKIQEMQKELDALKKSNENPLSKLGVNDLVWADLDMHKITEISHYLNGKLVTGVQYSNERMTKLVCHKLQEVLLLARIKDILEPNDPCDAGGYGYVVQYEYNMKRYDVIGHFYSDEYLGVVTFMFKNHAEYAARWLNKNAADIMNW